MTTVRLNLTDMEWDFVEAEAGARDMSVSDLLHEIIVEQAEIELGDMDSVLSARDSQCKSSRLN